MRGAKPELLKELSKYSKEDIIEALGRQYQADFIISGIVGDLEYIASKRLLDEHGKDARTLLERMWSGAIKCA